MTSKLKYVQRTSTRYDDLCATAPETILALLATNRQVHDEALGVFYWHNDLVFTSASVISGFLDSLSTERLMHLRNITLFSGTSEKGEHLEYALVTARLLPNVRKTHLLHRGLLGSSRHNPASASGAAAMFKFRGLETIKVRDVHLEDDFREYRKEDELVSSQASGPSEKYRTFLKIESALRHFNRGLMLAQKGVIVHSLYQDVDWHTKPLYPVLEGSICSAAHGCDCEEVDSEIVGDSRS